MMLLALILIGTGAAMAQTQASGTVTDQQGEPMIGVTVHVKGNTTTGTITDIDGKFALSVPKGSTLVISYVGYKTQELPATAGMKVVLVDDNEQLDEVIVVAYGTAKRSAFTGSATVINSDALTKKQATNVVQALAGQVAGLQMTSGSGQAGGDGPTMLLRGISSISAGTGPLIIVDGAPYDGGWNNINPADVESISVLKDAASNALYGARGANGVILITTKTAKRGNAVISVDAKWGFNEDAKVDYDNVRSPGEYYEMFYKAIYNKFHYGDGMDAYAAYLKANETIYKPGSQGGLGSIVYSVPQGEYLIGQNGKLNPHATLGNVVQHNGKEYMLYPDDWKKEGLRKGFRQEYNIGINGGTDIFKTYASIGYMKNNGICYGSDYTRYSARLKSEYQARKWLTFGGNISYTHSESNSSGNAFGAAHQVPPIYPVYLRDGKGNIMYDRNGKMYDYGNGAVNGVTREIFLNDAPLQNDLLNISTNSSNAYGMQGYADFSFLEDFKLTTNVSIYNTENRDNDAANPYYGFDKTRGGQVGVSHYRTFAFNTQQLLNYNKEFGKHTISALLGHEYTRNSSTTLTGRKNNIFAYKMNTELSGALTLVSANSYKDLYNIEGFFFRGQYDYDSKYFASASFRRDGSSRFHPKHRWGNFWSFGGAWIMTKEKWFKPKWVDMLKLKASFGQQGNDAIGDFYYSNFYDLLAVNGEGSLAFSNKGKQDITWETNTNINAGFEFELFKRRLTGSVELYQRKTTDMLLWFSVPPSLGYDGYYDNVGDMMNRGIEVNLDGDIIRTKELTWSAHLNMTANKNRIVRLAADKKNLVVDGKQGYQSSDYFYGEKLPMYTWYMYKYAGVDQTTGEALYYKNVYEKDANGKTIYYDANGKQVDQSVKGARPKVVGQETVKTTGEADLYLCGDPNPDAFGGFGTNLSWKGFDLAVDFTYQLGGKAYDNGYASAMNLSRGSAIHADILNAWSPTNKNSSIPRLNFNDNYMAAQSDRFLTSASYLNLQNITLGYTLPKPFVRNLGLANIRVYVTGDNVWLFSKRKGFDPRQSENGSITNAYYSPIRSVSGGVSVTF